MKKNRFTMRATAALALGVGLAVAVPIPASAHVGLLANTAEAGSTPVLTFSVPNESETLNTTALTIELPADTPFVSVRPVATAGWAAQVVVETLPEPVQVGDTTITEAATSVVWTATGGGFGGAEIGLFAVRVGPVPDVDSIALPALQGYSDGSVVPWEGEESPVLYVNADPVDHHGEAAAHDAEAGDTAPATGPDGTAIAGLVTGSVGLVLGATALALTLIRRRPAA